ncbi:MAG: DUF393 domain-containing protein [Gemmatimonadetes bacterium]|nr:DUF393 domain-containing protein [Gemmatimonadota bacterium]
MNGEALLLFDGQCRLCSRIVSFLGWWDAERRIAFLPYQSPLVARVLPDVAPRDLAEAMLLVAPDGERHRGADALPQMLALLPGGTPLRLLLALPGVPSAARHVYGWIAAHRHDIGCAPSMEKGLGDPDQEEAAPCEAAGAVPASRPLLLGARLRQA